MKMKRQKSESEEKMSLRMYVCFSTIFLFLLLACGPVPTKEECSAAQTQLGQVLQPGNTEPWGYTYDKFREGKVGRFLHKAYEDKDSQGKLETLKQFSAVCPEFLEFFDQFRVKTLKAFISGRGKDPKVGTNASAQNFGFISRSMDKDFRENNKKLYQLADKLTDMAADANQAGMINSYNQEIREAAAMKEALTTTSDSAYRVFLNTAHLPNQVLTNDQLSQNEKHYTGKVFTNWTLKLANISAGCVDFDEPQTGFNWGVFCGAQDVAAFKAKYPNYRKGMMFTIKSGKIARWVLGPHLAELTF